MNICEKCQKSDESVLEVYDYVEWEGDFCVTHLCEGCGESIGLTVQRRFHPVEEQDLFKRLVSIGLNYEDQIL